MNWRELALTSVAARDVVPNANEVLLCAIEALESDARMLTLALGSADQGSKVDLDRALYAITGRLHALRTFVCEALDVTFQGETEEVSST